MTDKYRLLRRESRQFSISGNANVRICWEIKMIQQEHKYYCLYDNVDFTPERRV